MYFMSHLFQSSTSFTEYVLGYNNRLCQLNNSLDKDILQKIVETIEHKINSNKTIFLAGNGGSSAVLSHWVNDLVVGNYIEGQKPILAINLSDNQSVITALGNDEGYDNIFVGQLRVLAKPEDILIAMSVSGNSPNIIKAVQWANANGLTTVGIAGCDGGKLIPACHYGLHIESTKDEYGPIEDIFSILTHIISTYLAQKRGKKLHH
ncbi:MAG: SIS domain-containing protein [Candidatus Hydrogenedens sp.]|nr:SIS domain-containing protein [Candidatus Hydrogenedens sp.]